MIEVYIDAATKGNPGPSGAGIVLKGEGILLEYSFFIGNMNNHEAEFYVLVKALELCYEKQFSIVSLRTDSKIVADSIEKQYVKNKDFKPYLDRALPIINQFQLFFIKWIPESQNKHADHLARQGIHKDKS